VFIAVGVGVTPLYSMVVTMRERQDVRPVMLFYASATWDDVVFREELSDLNDAMPNLDIIHVLDTAPAGWTGESGRITPDVLRRHLPAQFRRYEYLICGSSGLMDAMEAALVDVGVPFAQVSTERFDMV
jgi:predicted ferric reductase